MVGKDNETLRVVAQNKSVVSPIQHWGKTQLVLLAGIFWGVKLSVPQPPSPLLQQSPAAGSALEFLFFGFFLLGRTPSPSRGSGSINQTEFLWVLKVSSVTGAHSPLRNQSPQQRISQVRDYSVCVCFVCSFLALIKQQVEDFAELVPRFVIMQLSFWWLSRFSLLHYQESWRGKKLRKRPEKCNPLPQVQAGGSRYFTNWKTAQFEGQIMCYFRD